MHTFFLWLLFNTFRHCCILAKPVVVCNIAINLPNSMQIHCILPFNCHPLIETITISMHSEDLHHNAHCPTFSSAEPIISWACSKQSRAPANVAMPLSDSCALFATSRSSSPSVLFSSNLSAAKGRTVLYWAQCLQPAANNINIIGTR